MAFSPRGPKLSKEQLKAQAEAALKGFQAKGGVVSQLDAVVPTAFACANCGHTGMIGVRAGQKIKCPKCREVIKEG
ncbi:MAG: hypothetical protein U1E56_00325 [Bauldia sp.]